MAAAARLTLKHARGGGSEESATVVNLSPHGAEVIVPSYWEPNERILVRAPDGNCVALARVVYCHRQQRAQGFAIGLELRTSTMPWPPRPQRAA